MTLIAVETERKAPPQTLYVTGLGTPLGKLFKASMGRRARIVAVGPGTRRKNSPLALPLIDPKFAAAIRKSPPDAIVHLDIRTDRYRSEPIFEHNVLGTLHLVAAAAECKVPKVLITSSSWVYGGRQNNPNYIPEERRLRGKGATEWVKQLAEAETEIAEMARHYPQTQISILRFAPIVGPSIGSPFMRYLRLERPPTLLGFDPAVQMIHEADAAAAIVHALEKPASGPFNIAPDGMIPLVKLLRCLQRKPIPIFHLFASIAPKWTPPLDSIPFDPTYLRLSCCGANDRMKEVLGFHPKWSHEAILNELKKTLL